MRVVRLRVQFGHRRAALLPRKFGNSASLAGCRQRRRVQRLRTEQRMRLWSAELGEATQLTRRNIWENHMTPRFWSAARLTAILTAASLLSACGGSNTVPSSNPQRSGASAPTASGLAATASIETTGTASWPQPFMNGAHTGFNSLETTLNRTNVKTLTQLWSFPTGAQITDPVLVQNGVAYVNSGD